MSFSITSMIGLGYIGPLTAAALVSRQKWAVGVDVNQHTVEIISRGEIHIMEPDLAGAVKIAVEQGCLSVTTTLAEVDTYLIAVPMPLRGRHEPDMVFVKSTAKSIVLALKKGPLVILKSTSLVGPTEQMTGWLTKIRPDLSFL